jgi:hypothetical protein
MATFDMLPETPLVVPPGKKKGLLLRDDRPGESCGFLRDMPTIDVIPVAQWPEWIEAGITMRPEVPWIYDQDGVGSCAAESACGGLDLIRSVCGYEPVKFNPWGVYHYTGGGNDNGSTLVANLKFLRERGAYPESVWPRSKGYRATPDAAADEAAKKYKILEFYEVQSWEEFGSALLHRFPVYWGYTGHAILGVQLLNTSQFLYRNSWGEAWSDNGFGVANASSIQWGYGVYVVCNAILAD